MPPPLNAVSFSLSLSLLSTAYGGGATGPSGSVAVANNRKTKDAAAVLFEADAHKKPTTPIQQSTC